jgi:predicted lipoprotein with Yx(FWY)xxD motif
VRRLTVRNSALAVAVSVALAACSSSSKASSPASSAARTTVSAASSATVSVRHTHLGNVLVNSAGRTLYRYDKDTAGTSKCTDACTTVWPPLAVSGTLTYGANLRPAMFSTITRPDGTKQLAVNGSPLYTYSGDLRPGDTSGQGLGDFFVAGSNGNMIGHSS